MGRPETDFFGPGSNVADRFITDHKRLSEIVNGIRTVHPKLEIVLIMGSWDMLHVGHSRYIEEGSKYGDIVIIGVDSDTKVKERKGPRRPVVPQEERVEQLCHLRCVNLVVLKEVNEPKYHLIKVVRPNFLITIEENYTDEQREALKEFCGEIVVLPRQAETSTSAKIRNLVLDMGVKATQIAEKELAAASQRIGELIEHEIDSS